MEPGDALLYDYCILSVGDGFDSVAAVRLKEEILRYKLPKNVQSNEKSFKRIVVLSLPYDDESFVPEEYMEIAAESGWLVVICSEKTKNCRSVSHLLRYFAEHGRKANILPVLTHGEPKTAFPEEFFEERESRYCDGNGTEHVVTEIIEPLAVDIRASDDKESLRMLRHLKIKVVAALAGVSYDTLEQRQYKRMRRKLTTAASVLLAVSITFGSMFTYMWLNSRHSIDIAVKKTEVSKELFTKMCSEYPRRFEAVPGALPVIKALLLMNLEKLKVAESPFVQELDIDSLLVSEDGDDPHTSLIKAMILRYTGKSDQALPLYEKAASGLENGNVYIRSVKAFLKDCPPETFPSGVCILSIDESIPGKYGVREGDIIVAADGFKFRSMEQYNICLDSIDTGKTVEITILTPGAGGLTEKKIKMKREEIVFTSAEI